MQNEELYLRAFGYAITLVDPGQCLDIGHTYNS